MTAIKHRSSSFELYRIIVMMAIVAHHYVVNSGVMSCLSNGEGGAFLHALHVLHGQLK